MILEEGLDMPMPAPQYENKCWNCGAEINDVICMHAGYDPETGEPNGYECDNCGKHLGDYRRRHLN
jgi:DNA-directed RNA polymerase subunit RPC12/RpoP